MQYGCSSRNTYRWPVKLSSHCQQQKWPECQSLFIAFVYSPLKINCRIGEKKMCAISWPECMWRQQRSTLPRVRILQNANTECKSDCFNSKLFFFFFDYYMFLCCSLLYSSCECNAYGCFDKEMQHKQFSDIFLLEIQKYWQHYSERLLNRTIAVRNDIRALMEFVAQTN